MAAQADRPGVLMNAIEDRSGTVLRIASALADNPADNRRLEEWASWTGMSPRSMIRRFIAVIRFAFIEWHQQRLMRAVELLASRYPSANRRARSRVPQAARSRG